MMDQSVLYDSKGVKVQRYVCFHYTMTMTQLVSPLDTGAYSFRPYYSSWMREAQQYFPIQCNTYLSRGKTNVSPGSKVLDPE